MDTELNGLEHKVSQLVDFCRRLREENHQLRQKLATEQNDNRQLHEKLQGAKTRLEDLLNRIPES
jgi:cell division protein ZapB